MDRRKLGITSVCTRESFVVQNEMRDLDNDKSYYYFLLLLFIDIERKE